VNDAALSTDPRPATEAVPDLLKVVTALQQQLTPEEARAILNRTGDAAALDKLSAIAEGEEPTIEWASKHVRSGDIWPRKDEASARSMDFGTGAYKTVRRVAAGPWMDA
jgi:hypothetical protein